MYGWSEASRFPATSIETVSSNNHVCAIYDGLN